MDIKYHFFRADIKKMSRKYKLHPKVNKSRRYRTKNMLMLQPICDCSQNTILENKKASRSR